jgi:hypothetical protein
MRISPLPPIRSRHLRVGTVLALLALCLPAFAGSASAAVPRQGDCFEECPPTGPQLTTVGGDQIYGDYDSLLAKGQGFLCPKPSQGDSFDCRIEVTVTIPAPVARHLHVSRNIIDKVASHVVEHYTTGRRGRDQGRAYFATLSASVKDKLHAGHVQALGAVVHSEVTVPGQDKVFCAQDDRPTPRSSCSFDGNEVRTIYAAGDGELVCWTYMPWGLGVTTKWGARCPTPKHVTWPSQ